jgi:hypothetical protein
MAENTCAGTAAACLRRVAQRQNVPVFAANCTARYSALTTGIGSCMAQSTTTLAAKYADA